MLKLYDLAPCLEFTWQMKMRIQNSTRCSASCSELTYIVIIQLLRVKTARITESEKPLEIVQVADLKPHGTEVIIRVKSVGVCHSDLHLWEGGYDMGDGQFMKVTDRGVKYPVTPGHFTLAKGSRIVSALRMHVRCKRDSLIFCLNSIS